MGLYDNQNRPLNQVMSQPQQGQYPQQVQRPNPLAPPQPQQGQQQQQQQNPMPPYLQQMPLSQNPMPPPQPQMGANQMLPEQLRQQLQQAQQGIGQNNLPIADMQGRVQDNAGLPQTGSIRDRIKNKQLGGLAGLNR